MGKLFTQFRDPLDSLSRVKKIIKTSIVDYMDGTGISVVLKTKCCFRNWKWLKEIIPEILSNTNNTIITNYSLSVIWSLLI